MMDIELLQKAISLTSNGKYEEAREIYERLAEDNPNDSNFLSIYGLFYVTIGDNDKACELFQKSCGIRETFGNVSALGVAEYRRSNFRIAALVFQRALTLGENADVYDKLVNSLFAIKHYKRAIEYADKFYALYPQDLRAIICKIKAFAQSGELAEAEKLCVNTLKENMDSSGLWMQLGFLKELIYSDDEKALECYKLAQKNGNSEADYNIAVSYYKMGNFAESEKCLKEILKQKPEQESAISALGICYLAQKKFSDGFSLLFRRDKSKYEVLSNNFWKPGDKIDDEINILCDQGYGDNIQFIRYISCLKDKKINIATRTVLTQLFKENYPNLNYVKYEELNKGIQTFFITDLAYVLNIDFDNIPFSHGYLSVEPMEIQSEKIKVGFCWEAGSAGIRTMINRTINVKCFERLLNLENIQPYSFQVDDSFGGNELYTQMINLAKDFNDFYDTAKALKAMDIVVTVDTAVAHLAGALGVKTLLLLPYSTDWRWFGDTKSTPWYSSIEIFKQEDSISWQKPFEQIEELLKNFKRQIP